MVRFPNTFFGIRLRYIALILALLIIILVAAGYFSIQAGQKATLVSLTQQGRALTTVLIAAASNSIEADRQITDLAIDKIVTEIGAAAADPADANNDPDPGTCPFLDANQACAACAYCRCRQ